MQFAVSKTGRIFCHSLKMIKSEGLSYKMPENYIIDSKMQESFGDKLK